MSSTQQEYPSSNDPSCAPSSRSTRLPWLLVVLCILVVLLVLPWYLHRVQYSMALGRQRGEVEAIRESLGELNLKAMGKAFGMTAKAIGPSLVHIDTRRSLSRHGVDDELSHLLRRGAPGFEEGQASGVIVDPDGYILTNYHVVRGATDINVQLSDGRTLPAQKIGVDPGTDLALLKVNADGLVAATWGDSDQLEVGEFVFAVGNPFGLDRSITFGILSAKGRRGFSESPYEDFLQTDAAVNPGNSGGPLVDIEAKVVGINTAIVGPTFQGVSFAIPSNMAREVYEKLREGGKVPRGWLGVRMDDLTPELAKQLELGEARGVVVHSLLAGSPGEQAGLQPGDVIMTWDDKPVTDPRSLSLLVARTSPGSKVKVGIIRDGQRQTLIVPIGERPTENDDG